MKIQQTGNKLLVRETPGCLWFFSAFFVFVGGLFVYGSLGGFSDWDRVPWWALLFALVVGSIAFGVGIWMFSNAPITKVIINRTDQTVELTKLRLFGEQQIVYGFDQIKQFSVSAEKDDEGNLNWSLGMEFTSGKIEKITSLPNRFQQRKQISHFKSTHLCSNKCRRRKAFLKSEMKTNDK